MRIGKLIICDGFIYSSSRRKDICCTCKKGISQVTTYSKYRYSKVCLSVNYIRIFRVSEIRQQVGCWGVTRLIISPISWYSLFLSYSSLTILKIFASWYLSIFRLETSQHNLILPLGESVKFCPLFSLQILLFSDSSLTVLKVFAYWYLSVFGLETSQRNLILLLGKSAKFAPYFRPRFCLFLILL